MMRMIQQDIRTAPPTPHLDEIVTRFGIICKGMEVWGHDGKIGRLVLIIRSRYTNEPSHLVVQSGWFWGRCMLIPLHWAIDVVGCRIKVNLRKHQIDHLAEYRSDKQIAREVQAAIYTSPTFMPGGECATIRVLVQHGVVTLSGNARDQSRRFEAQRITNGIKGVQELRNELIADDDLRRWIEQEIMSDPFLPTFNLSVSVNLGLVEIRGYLPTSQLYERLLKLVCRVNGVRAIWNNLVTDSTADSQAQSLNIGPAAHHVQRRAELNQLAP